MSNLENFTRWNRTGLEQFRYIDGNAATYLEEMRQHLSIAFPDWDRVKSAGLPNETIEEKRERIEAQYFAPRGDWAWEILRTYARSSHILLEHINAFANEGFLSTATQWEYLRRLVEMLDYRPRPQASASTLIALLSKADAQPGLVKKGLQLAYQPEDGDRLVFESLTDVEVDPILDELRLFGYDRNPRHIANPFQGVHWLAPEKHEMDQGQPAILAQDGHGLSVLIHGLNEGQINIKHNDVNPPLSNYIRGDAVLLTEFDSIYNAALNGANVYSKAEDLDIAPGQVVGIKNNANQYGFAMIGDVDRVGFKLLSVNPASLQSGLGQAELYGVISLSQQQFVASGNEWRLPYRSSYNLIGIGSNQAGSLQTIQTALTTRSVAASGESGVFNYSALNNMSGYDLHLLDLDRLELLTETSRLDDLSEVTFEGGPGQLSSGDMIVAEDDLGARTVLKISELREFENSFILRFDQAPVNLVNVKRIFGPFKNTLRPIGAERNPDQAKSQDLLLDLKQSETPQILSAGRWVIIEPETEAGSVEAFKAKIAGIDFKIASDGSPRALISFDKTPDAFDAYSVGNVIIRANTVECGHGKTKSSEVMGSGNATQNNQSILIEADDVSYVSDPEIEAGVRADISVSIEDQFYAQISDLAYASPTDPAYEARITEEGFSRIIFGDGENARRLPSGTNNILMTIRYGTGSIGNNIPPFSFEKLSTPHARIDKARQPLTTSGGQDRENTEQIRTNAPSYLKALGRAVSLPDFEHLARITPGIWHAKAFENIQQFSRETQIELCVVPVDGAPLGGLEQSLAQKLRAVSAENINVVVTQFDSIYLDCHIILRVDQSQFDPIGVEADLRARLFEALKLEKRGLGVPLFISNIYNIVEMTRGVANSHIRLFGNKSENILSENGVSSERVTQDTVGTITTIRPTPRQTLYLTSPGAISIKIEENWQ